MWNLEAKADQVQAKIIEAIGIRLCVHTVQAGDLVLANEFGRLHVGGNHAFLNKSVGVIPGDGTDVLHRAILADIDSCLGNVQLDSAALAPVTGKQTIHFMQIAHEVIGDPRRTLCCAGLLSDYVQDHETLSKPLFLDRFGHTVPFAHSTSPKKPALADIRKQLVFLEK